MKTYVQMGNGRLVAYEGMESDVIESLVAEFCDTWEFIDEATYLERCAQRDLE